MEENVDSENPNKNDTETNRAQLDFTPRNRQYSED